MAITITNPISRNNSVLPSGNPIKFTAVSDQHGILDSLHYKVSVYVDNVCAATLLYPSINADGITIDVRNIVCDYISENFSNDEYTGAFFHGDECVSLKVSFVERYKNGGYWTDSTTIYHSKDFFVWMAAAQLYDERPIIDFINYYTAGTCRWMGIGWQMELGDLTDTAIGMSYKRKLFSHAYIVTSAEDTQHTVRTATSMQHFKDGVGTIWERRYYHICAFDADFRLNKHIVYDNAPMIYDAKHLVRSFPCGVIEISQISLPGTVTLFNGQYFDIDSREDSYYCIWCSNDMQPSLNIPSSNLTYVVPFKLCDNNRYDLYHILYKTSAGGWWQIRCNMKNSKSISIDGSYRINADTSAADTELGNDASFKTAEHISAKGTWTLNTDWIDCDEKIAEVEDMMRSPRLYIIDNRHYVAVIKYTPVILKSTDMDIKSVAQDKLVQYQFQFEEAFYKPVIR